MGTLKKFALLILFLIPLGTFAQTTISGVTTEKATGLPLPGVNILVKGTATGAISDFDGNFQIKADNGATLVFSYLGFTTQETIVTGTNITIAMEEDASKLDEVVVIGYGTVKKKDATGSVSVITAKDFNKGPVVSADQLLQGKMAGIQIINGGGSPGEGSTIRIRSGSSLSANNDPLYIIDGIPVDTGGITGGRNILATINQNDIESINVLKDASATAIYGSRASNGVIIIVTKRGKAGDLKVTYTSNFSTSQLIKKVDVLSADEYRTFVNTYGNDNQKALLGTNNTDWQDEIYQTAFGTDQNISLTGGDENLVYRLSTGYTNMNGILKKDKYERTSLSIGLTANLLDDHLKIDINNNTSINKNNYSNRGAIGAAISFNPTSPIFEENAYGNYFQWLNGSGTQQQLAGKNPVSLLEQVTNFGESYRSIGNIQFDYKMHFLPELKAIANLGYDLQSGKSFGGTTENFASSDPGSSYENTEERKNNILDLYFNYKKEIEAINTVVDVTAGYSYQDFRYPSESTRVVGGNSITIKNEERLNLQSFFARTNLSIKDKYLITLSYRRDGSSRFTKENRWGNFPAAAIAWKVNEENFLKDSNIINTLKLRASWGITGQQNIGESNRYPSTPLYTTASQTAAYQFGYDGTGQPIFISPIRPEPYNSNLIWENTETINAGLDFALFNNTLSGSVDAYQRITRDLIVLTSNPQGVGFSNQDFYNIGDMENRGIELALSSTLINSDDLNIEISGNITFQSSEVTKLTLVDDPDYKGIDTGGIAGGTGNNIQNHQVGFSPNSFYVYEQGYDVNGNPLEGVYVDRNQDGLINADDKYRLKKPAADFYYGFNTNASYKKWDISMQWRGSYGNYNYNNVDSSHGYRFESLIRDTDIYNSVSNVLESNFQEAQQLSDYYIQDASFLKLDNITLGYVFNSVFSENSTLKLSGSVQNVLTITNYDGIDPEISGGIDNNLYPRPRIYALGIHINF